MARRKKVPLFEVMQQGRLKEQQRAAQADLQSQRERLRAQRRVEEEAKAAADLAENGPPKPSVIAGLLDSFGLTQRTDPARPAPISPPDRNDPTAGRHATSLYRQVRESRPKAEPKPEPQVASEPDEPNEFDPTLVARPVARVQVSAPGPVKRSRPSQPRKPRLAGLTTAANGLAQQARTGYAQAAKKLSSAVQRRAGAGFDPRSLLGPVPIALGSVGLVLLVALVLFAFGDNTEIADSDRAERLPLDPAVTDIGDGNTTAPPEVNAARVVKNAPPIIVEPEPTANRERGKIYVAVMSYRTEQKADADRAAADLRRAGISVTVEYDLKAYPDRYTVVGTKAFNEPGVGDWEPYVNNIKDVSENRRRSGKHDPFQAAALFWAR